jgi:pimeloyl-ACP methyl ester carboxylesterase
MTLVQADESGPDDGPLIVVVHGSMDRSAGMLRLCRQLDGTHRVARYDRRGYGRSVPDHGPHPGPFDMSHQVADLVGVLAGRPAVVVGHSYGGNVALALAATYPDLVRGVVIYETPLSWEPWWPGNTAGAVAVASADDPDGPAGAAERFMRRMIGDARWEALPERTRATRRAEGAAMVGELTDLRANEPWTAERITVPVIAGYGTLGSPHHTRGMQFVADRIEGARAVALPDARHDAPLGHAALFADLLVRPMLAELGS